VAPPPQQPAAPGVVGGVGIAAAAAVALVTRIVRRPFLVGAWTDVRVDPSVWGVAGASLLDFSVRAAYARAVEVRCATAGAPNGYEPGVGVRPRLWRRASGELAVGAAGLQEREAAQRARFQALPDEPMAAAAATPSSRGRRAAAPSMPPVPAWMRATAGARAHPLVRAAQAPPPRPSPLEDALLLYHRDRQSGGQQQPADGAHGRSVPALDDSFDPFAPRAGHEAAGRAWVAAYRRAAAPHLPRELRAFGWLLLHGGLHCGGSRTRGARMLRDCACPLVECRGPGAHWPGLPPGQGQMPQSGGADPRLPPVRGLRMAGLTHVLL